MKIVKIILPIIIVKTSVYYARQLIINKPNPEKRKTPKTIVKADVQRLNLSDFSAIIGSYPWPFLSASD